MILIIFGVSYLILERNVGVFVVSVFMGSGILVIPKEEISRESAWNIIKEAYCEFYKRDPLVNKKNLRKSRKKKKQKRQR